MAAVPLAVYTAVWGHSAPSGLSECLLCHHGAACQPSLNRQWPKHKFRGAARAEMPERRLGCCLGGRSEMHHGILLYYFATLPVPRLLCFFHLFERVRGKEVFLQGDAPDGCSSQGRARPKSGVSSKSVTWVQGLQRLGHLPWLPRPLAGRELEWLTLELAPTCGAGIAANSVTCCAAHWLLWLF